MEETRITAEERPEQGNALLSHGSEGDRDYYVKKRTLYRKVVDSLEGSGLTTAAVIATLKDVSENINRCRNSKPMDSIMDEMRSSRFYRDT